MVYSLNAVEDSQQITGVYNNNTFLLNPLAMGRMWYTANF